MKKTYLYSALLLAGMSLTTSCSSDFLELRAVGSEDKETLSKNIDVLLSGCYSGLYAQEGHRWDMGYRSLSGWIFGDVIGGDANKGSTAADQPNASNLEQWLFLNDNDYLNGKWTASYEAAKRANAVLEVAELMNPEEAKVYQAQARFVKGVQMFEAIKVFGAGVPYVSLEDYMSSNDPQVTNHKDGQLIYIWDKVEEDLKFAAENLPESWSDDNKGRINKYAAEAVLAKLYLYWSSPYNNNNGANANKWAECKKLLEDIILNGKTSDGKKLALHPSYYEIFTPDKGDFTSENVFDVQYQIEGTAWQTCTINGCHAPAPQFIEGAWGFYQPSYQYTNSFIVDEEGLPSKSYMSHEPLAKTTPDGNEAISDLETFVDPRLDMTAGRFEVPYYDWTTPSGKDLGKYIRAVDNAGLFFNKKYNPMKSEAGAISDCPLASNKNLHVIRFAEVLLMAAEVAIHDGDLPTAQKYINQIRERAANSAWWIKNESNPHMGYSMGKKVEGAFAANYKIGLYTNPFADADEAMEALRREIRLEIGMEGNRWFDLCRWGIADKALNEYAAFENQFIPKYKNTYKKEWVTLPLPLSQVAASDGRFIQNEVWK